MEVFKTVFLAAPIILFLLQLVSTTHNITTGRIETDRVALMLNIFGKVIVGLAIALISALVAVKLIP